MNTQSSTALFIDTYTRDLKTFSVSVTEVVGKGLVLRMGAELGPLWLLLKEAGGELKPELPILVSTKGYKAQSSEGFVDVFAGNRTGSKQNVIGIQGFPWMKTGALNPVREPFQVVVLRPGTNIREVNAQYRWIHEGGGFGHTSNRRAATAAYEGLALLVKARPQMVVVSSGQSDYTGGIQFIGYYTLYEDSWQAVWPEEHQRHMFGDYEALAAHIARLQSELTWFQDGIETGIPSAEERVSSLTTRIERMRAELDLLHSQSRLERAPDRERRREVRVDPEHVFDPFEDEEFTEEPSEN